MKPRIVFDIDDTICKEGKRLGYDNAIPIRETIRKINQIHEDLGAEIVLYTARGMGSCAGNAEAARTKNEKTLIEWLKRHNVWYDELVFGKPLADLYVDDKGISLPDFLEKDFRILHGGSGATIYQLGDIVAKQMQSIEEAERVIEWSKGTKLKHPKIIGNVYETLYMEYIDGRPACDCMDEDLFNAIMIDVEKEAGEPAKGFRTELLLQALDRHKGRDAGIDDLIEDCKQRLRAGGKALQKHASASHGDMTLSNIIVRNGERYYIDPRHQPEASTYLLDLAKLRMSLSGYERIFGINAADLREWLAKIDRITDARGITKIVKTLELMYILRLTKYGKDPTTIRKFAEEVRAEID